MYTSRATELGRGDKVNKLSDAPEWTPGPGTYQATTDFVKQDLVAKKQDHKVINEKSETMQEQVIPWN